jgi:DNA-binding NarL/FixJ family response regulator
LEATRQVLALPDAPKVLVLTTFDRNDWVYEALKAGASGYVLKRAADTDLVDAIRAVARGGSFISPHAEGTLLKRMLDDPDSDPTEKLTPREREVVKLIAEAYTNKEIAAILNLAEKTVESHRANVLAKLGMRDRVELVRYAIRRGLIEP